MQGPPRKIADRITRSFRHRKIPLHPFMTRGPVKTTGIPDDAVVPATPSDEQVPGEMETEPESSVPASPSEGPGSEETGSPGNMAGFTEPGKNPGISHLVLPDLLLHIKNLPEPGDPGTIGSSEKYRCIIRKAGRIPGEHGNGRSGCCPGRRQYLENLYRITGTIPVFPKRRQDYPIRSFSR